MLDFINTFFRLLGDFVTMLYSFEILQGVSLGEFIASVLILSLILSFLFKGWLNNTFKK